MIYNLSNGWMCLLARLRHPTLPIESVSTRRQSWMRPLERNMRDGQGNPSGLPKSLKAHPPSAPVPSPSAPVPLSLDPRRHFHVRVALRVSPAALFFVTMEFPNFLPFLGSFHRKLMLGLTESVPHEHVVHHSLSARGFLWTAMREFELGELLHKVLRECKGGQISGADWASRGASSVQMPVIQ
jgi:hypothetical protein